MHIQTPVFRARELEKDRDRQVLLKMEAFQPSGSFKIRGIGRLMQEAWDSGGRHFVSSSGGNAGYAAAYAGSQLGARVTVVVPRTTPPFMQNLIRSEGADVQVVGDVWDEADQHARRLVEREGAVYVSPFDHPTIWAGHATLVEEVRDAGLEPDCVVLSVGGGGLLCGVVEGLQRAGWRHVPVLAVETEGMASFAAAVRAGHLVTLDRLAGVATSLGARRVAARALECARIHPVTPWVVSDEQALDACHSFLRLHRVLVEPACGAALAALHQDVPALAAARRPLVVVCGGAGDTLACLAPRAG